MYASLLCPLEHNGLIYLCQTSHLLLYRITPPPHPTPPCITHPNLRRKLRKLNSEFGNCFCWQGQEWYFTLLASVSPPYHPHEPLPHNTWRHSSSYMYIWALVDECAIFFLLSKSIGRDDSLNSINVRKNVQVLCILVCTCRYYSTEHYRNVCHADFSPSIKDLT